MERLGGITKPEDYNKIFWERSQKPVDEFDMERWQKLSSRFKGGKLIDLGCLDSLIPTIVKKRYPKSECWAMDYAEEAIKIMDASCPDAIFMHGDILRTGFAKNTFDYVILGEVIEHIDSPQECLDEAVRILKPGGTLAISTPLEETRKGEVDHIHHLWSFTKEDMHGMLDKYGKVSIKVLRSKKFPYKYRFPSMIVWLTKI